MQSLFRKHYVLAIDQKMNVRTQLSVFGKEVFIHCREGVNNYLDQLSRGGILGQVEENGFFADDRTESGEKIDLHITQDAVQKDG